MALSLILAIASVIVTSIPKGNGKSVLQTAFNEYANYLLYGTESDADIEGEFLWGYRYCATATPTEADDDYPTYLNELQEKYSNFANLAPAIITDYDDTFWLFYYTALYPDLPLSLVFSAEQEGIPATNIEQRIVEYYTPMLESGHDIVIEYANFQIDILMQDNASLAIAFPDTSIDIYSGIWQMMEEIYEN